MNQPPNHSVSNSLREKQELSKSADESLAAIRSRIGWLTLLTVLAGEDRGRELINEALIKTQPQSA